MQKERQGGELVISLRIWRSPVQTSLKTKNLLNYKWCGGSLKFKIYTMLFVYIHDWWSHLIGGKFVFILHHYLPIPAKLQHKHQYKYPAHSIKLEQLYALEKSRVGGHSSASHIALNIPLTENLNFFTPPIKTASWPNLFNRGMQLTQSEEKLKI